MENYYSAIEEYPDLENHNSHMAHCLTEEIYKRMREFKTSSGFTIDDAIQTGIDDPGDPYHMSVGCVAGDEDSYEVFKEFFDEVIEARHNGYRKIEHPKPNVDIHQEKSSCLDNSFVVSCRVRSVRNLKGFCLPSHCTRAERRKVESIVKNACLEFTGDFKGKYVQAKDDFRISNIKTEDKKLPSCMTRDWPDGRSVFATENNDFTIQVNAQDHLRFVAIQQNGDLLSAFSRCYKGLHQVEKHLNENGNYFMYSDALGYKTTCPGNLGTAMKASVRMRIPELLQHFRIEEILTRLRLRKQTCGTNEKKSDSLVDISNLDTLGVTENETIVNLIDGVCFLAKSERKLEKEQSIEIDINRIRK